MPLKTALLFLFEKLGHRERCVIVSFKQMLTWENYVLPILLKERLIIEAELAQTLPCHCGEKGCVMNIISSNVSDEFTGKPLDVWYFGICNKNGAVEKIENCWLKQWQITPQMLIDWLMNYLRLESPKEANRVGVVQLGTLTLNSENYVLALGTADELVLLVNGSAILMTELFSVSEGGAIEVNTGMIGNAHNALIPKSSDKAKRNAQMFKKYHEIKTQFPNLKTDNDVIPQMMKDKELVGDLDSKTIRRILSSQKKLSK